MIYTHQANRHSSNDQELQHPVIRRSHTRWARQPEKHTGKAEGGGGGHM